MSIKIEEPFDDPRSSNDYVAFAAPVPIKSEIEDSVNEDWIDDIDITEFASINNTLEGVNFDHGQSESVFIAPAVPIKQECSTDVVRRDARKSTTPSAKPAWSYSILIGLALRCSENGCLAVADIYTFMCTYFPYFRSAPGGWKNSVRHNLSLNRMFEKIEEGVDNTPGKKCCLWRVRKEQYEKLSSEIEKWMEKDKILRELAVQFTAPNAQGPSSGPRSSSDHAIYCSSKVKVEVDIDDPRMDVKPSICGPSSDHLEDIKYCPEAPLKENSGLSETEIGPIRPKAKGARKPPSVSRPSILGRNNLRMGQQRGPRREGGDDPPSAAALVKVAPPKHLSPDKRRMDLMSMSPIRNDGKLSDYDVCSSALSDNSLLTFTMTQSPFKGPVTFPPDINKPAR